MKLRNVLLPIAVVSALCGVCAPFAGAQSTPQAAPTVAYVGPDAGRNDATSSGAAGSWNFNVNGKIIKAFCVEMTKTLDSTATYQMNATTAISVPNLDRVSYIAANHATLGTVASDAQFEAAATQVAIWNLTDSFTIDATSTPNATVRARALELVAASAGHTNPSAIAGGKLTVAVAAVPGDTSKVTVAAHLTDTADNALAGQTVKFNSSTANATATTDASGNASVQLNAPAPLASLTYTATWNGASLPGALVVPSSATGQVLLLSQSADLNTTVQQSFTAAASTTTTAVATTTTAAPPSSTTATAASPIVTNVGSLPFTGGSDGPSSALVAALVGGAVLAAAAAAALLFKRSRLH